jgi:hypothetical protein
MIAMSRPLGSNVEMLIRNLFGRKNFNWTTQSGLLISLLLCGVLFAQNASSPVSSPEPSNQAESSGVSGRNLQGRLPRRANLYYQGFWGVDSFKVKTAESGELIRFSWRVLDPNKAAALNNKKTEPSLVDPQAGVQLVVPSLEKIGQLRQSSTPVAGKSYWMAFSNPGRTVKRGDRVDVVIGQFRVEGLVVE